MTDAPRILTAAEHAAIWRKVATDRYASLRTGTLYGEQVEQHHRMLGLANFAVEIAVAYEAAAKEEKTP